jgi:outer membrane protein TolC
MIHGSAPRWLLVSFLSLLVLPLAAAAETEKPLTLVEALAAASTPHPDLQSALAEREASLADQRLAAGRNDPTLNLEGILRSGRPTQGLHDFTDDNSIRLTARKTLYDFGRTRATEAAAGSDLQARDAALLDTRQRRYLEIMARFFEVLLADLQYSADDEFMATVYTSFDHGRDRLETGLISRVELAELEARFEETKVRRNASQQRRRITRALLANAMNQPGKLMAELEDPKLQDNDRRMPEYETLIPAMLSNNPVLQAQQKLLDASQSRLAALRAERNPTLDVELQAADYSRIAPTRDSVSAAMILSWPLYQGGRVDARIAREQAQFHKLLAASAKLDMQLTQSLLETWLDIEQLQRTVRSAAKKQADYRDLALERSRGEYEVELKTTLGTSMAETVQAKVSQRRTEYQLALGFARLDALLGRTLGHNPGSGPNRSNTEEVNHE